MEVVHVEIVYIYIINYKFRCCCLVATCGMCDFGKNKKKYSKEHS